MNRGLLMKGLRETWLLTLLCGLGAMLFEALVAYFFWSYQEQFKSEIIEMDFVRQMIEALVGADLGDAVDFGALTSLAWVHPMFLSILFAHGITVCTRMPAGEIDRGTIDVLFGMPLSRPTIYVSETATWLAGGAIIVAFGLAGSMIGHSFVPIDSRPETGRLVFVLANLFALYYAVGAFALLVSAGSNRRGRAIGIAFSVLLVHFIWNFLGQYWSFAEGASFLSVLAFFKPLPILSEGSLPVRDLAVLLSTGTVCWVAGLVVFVRRDIQTV